MTGMPETRARVSTTRDRIILTRGLADDVAVVCRRTNAALVNTRNQSIV